MNDYERITFSDFFKKNLKFKSFSSFDSKNFGFWDDVHKKKISTFPDGDLQPENYFGRPSKFLGILSDGVGETDFCGPRATSWGIFFEKNVNS